MPDCERVVTRVLKTGTPTGTPDLHKYVRFSSETSTRLKADRDDDLTLGEPPGERHDLWWFMPTPQVAAVAVMAMLTARRGARLGDEPHRAQLRRRADRRRRARRRRSRGPRKKPKRRAPNRASPPKRPPTRRPPKRRRRRPPEPSAPPAEAPPPLELPPEIEEEPLPEIKHVFLIVLDGHGYEEAFGAESAAPYLAETLAAEGKLLANYYAVAAGRPRQPGRPAQRPGADPADARRLPRIRADRARRG